MSSLQKHDFKVIMCRNLKLSRRYQSIYLFIGLLYCIFHKALVRSIIKAKSKNFLQALASLCISRVSPEPLLVLQVKSNQVKFISLNLYKYGNMRNNVENKDTRLDKA